MKKSAVKLFDKLIVLLLGFLGVFSSCEKDTEENNPIVEYGMPFATYEIKGVVTDKETAKPIQNIRIIRSIYQEYGDTLYTDANGKYAFTFSDFPQSEQTFKLKVDDIDAEENGGLFNSKAVDVVVTQADKVENGQGWYSGKFVKTKNIELNNGPIPMYGVPSASFKSEKPEQ